MWVVPDRGRAASECLVGGEDLVDPAAELGDAGVDGGSGGGAAAASPGDDTDQGPGVVLLAHQGTARVALETAERQVRRLETGVTGE